jgi:murein L,D-transpeptidase YcbB/YkuD
MLQELADTSAAESRLSYTAESFFRDVAYGKPHPLSFDGIGYSPSCVDVTGLLDLSLKEGTFGNLLYRIESQTTEYLSLKSALAALNDSLTLFTAKTTDLRSDHKIKSIQNKVIAVKHALNTIRWMSCLINKNFLSIVVNIPSATLTAYHNRKAIFETKVIVGKKSTRTPVFISKLTDITIYPYWYVPKSIATKELLPQIKKDISYIDANNFQILDKNGKVLNPYSVSWKQVTADNFPYTIRQSTGCDNSLGIIKLNINHPNNIYLHDTPWKSLFESPNRFFSHGCIRVERAKELAQLVLKENHIAVDTLDERASPLLHYPRTVLVDKNIVVLVLYNTAWVDAAGMVRFYADIYSRLTKS